HRPPLQSPRSPDLPTRADRLPHGAHNHAAVCATLVRTEAPATTPRSPQERPHLKMLTKLLPLKNLDHPPLYDPPSFRIRSFMTRVAALTPATTLATFVKRFPPDPRTTLWTCWTAPPSSPIACNRTAARSTPPRVCSISSLTF